MILIERIDMLASIVASDIKNIKLKIGNKANLTTEEKETIVTAINSIVHSINIIKKIQEELKENKFTDEEKQNLFNSLQLFKQKIDEQDLKLGNKDNLKTENKDNFVKAINSLVKNINITTRELLKKLNGKATIESVLILNKKAEKIEDLPNMPIKKSKKAKEIAALAKATSSEVKKSVESIKERNNLINSSIDETKTTINKIIETNTKIIETINNNKNKLNEKLNKNEELHFKKGTYNIINNSVILKQVDENGAEKELENVIINKIAEKINFDKIKNKISNLLNIKNNNKNDIVSLLNSFVENKGTGQTQNINQKIEEFKAHLQESPETVKALEQNNLSTDPFDLISALVKKNIRTREKAYNADDEFCCLLNNENKIKNFINKYKLKKEEVGIKIIQGNINKYIPFDESPESILNLPSELDVSQDFNIEIHNIFGEKEKTFSALEYKKYFKKSEKINKENLLVIPKTGTKNLSSSLNKNTYFEENQKERAFKVIEENDINENNLIDIYEDKYKGLTYKNNGLVTFINKPLTKYFNVQKNSWQPTSDLVDYNIKDEINKITINKFFENFDEYVKDLLIIKTDLMEEKSKMYIFLNDFNFYGHIGNNYGIESQLEVVGQSFNAEKNPIPIINKRSTQFYNRISEEWIDLTQEQKEILTNKIKEKIINSLKHIDYSYSENELLSLSRIRGDERKKVERPTPSIFVVDKNNFDSDDKVYTNVLYDINKIVVVDNTLNYFFNPFTREWNDLESLNIPSTIDSILERYKLLFNREINYTFTDFPNSNIITEDNVKTYIFTKEELITNNKSIGKNINNTNKIFVNELGTKFYNSQSNQWESIEHQMIKSSIQNNPVFIKYKEFLERKNKMLEILKTVNFNDKGSSEMWSTMFWDDYVKVFSRLGGHDIAEVTNTGIFSRDHTASGTAFIDQEIHEKGRKISCKIFSSYSENILPNTGSIINASFFSQSNPNSEKIKIKINRKKDIALVIVSDNLQKFIKINKNDPLIAKLADSLIGFDGDYEFSEQFY